MEKIYLVKGRNKSIQEIGRESPLALRNNFGTQRNKLYEFKELNKDEHKILSFGLTPEQGEHLRSNCYFQSLLTGTAKTLSLNMERRNEGQFVFNFHVEKDTSLRLLKAKHVCQMLQVSSGFLRKLVKAEKIKSYKLGRLRRFSLEDVLVYLTEK